MQWGEEKHHFVDFFFFTKKMYNMNIFMKKYKAQTEMVIENKKAVV